MRIKILLIVLFMVIAKFANTQNSYQTYPSAGFKIICNCKLITNSVFIQAAKSSGVNNILGAYICVENENDPQTAVIVNINVYDESASFQKFKSTLHDYLKKKLLEKYADNINKAGFKYEYVSFQGETALEYNFDQNGVPTKAIVFFKNQKSYLLQLATRSSLTAKYIALKSNFVII